MSVCCDIPYGYCHCGCGEKTKLARDTIKARGIVAGQPQRYLLGHYNRRHDPQYKVDPDTGCWIWQWFVSPDGYGCRRVGKQNIKAHRVEYERVHGPVPAGLQIDHLCRNRRCVNPAHLEAVTPAENVRRSNCTKLTPETVREIRDAPSWAVQELATRFGVTHWHAFHLRSKNFKWWKGV